MNPLILRRAVQIFALLLVLLTVVEMVEGDSFADAVTFAATWGVISAAVFAVVQTVRLQRGASCEVCEDARMEDGARSELKREPTDEEKATVLFQ